MTGITLSDNVVKQAKWRVYATKLWSMQIVCM